MSGRISRCVGLVPRAVPMFRVGGCLNRLASSSPCSTFPSPSAADVSLIPALVSRSKWKISKTDIYTPPPPPLVHARRPRKIPITGYSREEKRIGREKRILFSYRVTLSFFTTDRSIHRSRGELRFSFSKPRIESSRVESNRIIGKTIDVENVG